MNDRASTDLMPFVRRDVDARGVVTLTLDRPQSFNSLSEGMLAALQGELDAIAVDERVRAVVIAAGGKAFCAGHDLKEMRAKPSQAYYEDLFARCAGLMLTLQKLPVPVIARVQGIATAAGCQLVAACDLAVAVKEARFAVSGVNLGLFCSSPSVALARTPGYWPIQARRLDERAASSSAVCASSRGGPSVEGMLVDRIALVRSSMVNEASTVCTPCFSSAAVQRCAFAS